MKLVIIIMITCFVQVSAATYAQKLTYSKKGASMEEIFKEIKKQTGYNVLYSPEKVDDRKKIDVDFKETELPEVLDKVTSNQSLEYSIDDKNISIRPRQKSVIQNIVDRFNNIDVHGKILDSEGKGLPGASVKVKSTGKAVSTDAKGNFFLRGVEEGAVLIVSFIGYLPKEVLASANIGSIVLEQGLSKLDEVQVIAYGTTTQRLSTGNVTTIKADVIEKQPVNNPLLALQGRVPGLFIEQATGFAGTGVKVRIQGTNSLNYGSDPLYVIDGVPYTSQLFPGGNSIVGSSGGSGDNASSVGNPMSFINPSDIESIDVLKDADATAIYGSRAANGAILITTKKGKIGDVKVDFNLQTGIAKVPHKLDLMNRDQYLEMRREALKNDGIISLVSGTNGDSDLNGDWDNSRNTDWQKELIGRTAQYNDFNASVSGGSINTVFLIGAGYHRETNVFPGDFSDSKASVHFSINNTSTNQRFKIQFSGSYLLDNNKLPQIDLTSFAMIMPPVAPALFKPDGTINWQIDGSGASTFNTHPMGYLYDEFKDRTNNLISNALVSYILIPGLSLNTSFGYVSFSSNNIQKHLLKSSPPEYVKYLRRNTTFGHNINNSWSIEPQLNFKRSIAKGKLEVLLGSTLTNNNSSSDMVNATGFSNDLVMEDIRSATALRVITSINALYKYNALFSRINYNWKEKYILNLTARRDGSSRFGSDNQFHNFGAVGMAWLFSEEKLLKDKFPALSFGKIKFSYGITGSDQINDYQFLSLYDPIQAFAGALYQDLVSYQPNKLANESLQWEATKKLQLGFDLGFLNDRILFNAIYYRNRSSNQLSQYSLPTTTGFGSVIRNQNYKIQNSGWELMLSTTNFKSNNFNWKTNVNLTLPKTLLIDYPDIDKSSAGSQLVLGLPLSVTRVLHYLGVDPATGIYQFADKNGNPTTTPTFEDRTVILDNAPKFYGGIDNSFSYKGFNISVLLAFVKQIALNNSFGNFAVPGTMYGGQGNQMSSMLERWQKPGDIAPIQKYSSNTDLYTSWNNVKSSDAAWNDASYVRLKNISISWQLPKLWAKELRFQNCNLFVQGQNLWTLTAYTGLDPETKNSYSLPPLRVITMGLKITL